MTKTVIFDVDDTSGNLKEHLQTIYREATGNHSISFNDWDDFNAKDRYGITSDELGDLFIKYQALQKMKVHQGIVEVTALLKASGYNIEIVTARGWHPEGFDITKKWLEDNYITYDKINIVPLFQCKEEATRHIPRIELFVDDRLDHCQNMMESGRVNKCLLFAQPWNRHYKNSDERIVRIENLYEVLDHLEVTV